MIIRSQEELERMLANGEIEVEDADEVRNFMDFLSEAPSHSERKTPEGKRKLREVYLKHYPEHTDERPI